VTNILLSAAYPQLRPHTYPDRPRQMRFWKSLSGPR